MILPTLDENDLVASISRESFAEFLKEFWEETSGEKLKWNWHIDVLCDELQTLAERVIARKPRLYDLIINISPGSTKSTICSVAFPVWVWTRFPQARLICASYTDVLALDLSRKTRDIFTSKKYQDCFDLQMRDDQNAKGYFINKKGGCRVAVGTGGSITGFHGHFIIVDDPIDPTRAISEPVLKEVNRWMFENLSTRKVDKEITPTILIMQRLHQDDPSGHWIEKAKGNPSIKIKHICLPAEETENINPPELKKYYIDGLMDPRRLSRNVLKEAREALGNYGYGGQFLQSPIPLGGGMFKVDQIKLESRIPTMIEKIRYWDKAGSVGKGCYTVGVLLGKDKSGRFWVLDVVRGQWDSHDREKVILQTAKADGFATIIGIEQEPGSGGLESAQATSRMLAGYRIRIDRPVGDKALRADPYSVQVNNGNVFLKEGVWNAAYLNELRFFPHSKYKDQVDASSGAFSLLQKKRVGGF